MAIESFYFSHDYNARSDRKLMALQMSMGLEGIGIYWCIVEMLYEEAGYLMLSECERIAFELRTDKERITQVVNSDLFINDGVKFWSESILRRLDKRHEKSQKARESAKKRWKDANAMRTHSEGNAIKERKGKEIKEKEIYNMDYFDESIKPSIIVKEGLIAIKLNMIEKYYIATMGEQNIETFTILFGTPPPYDGFMKEKAGTIFNNPEHFKNAFKKYWMGETKIKKQQPNRYKV